MSPRDLARALARTAGEGAPRVGDAVDGVHAARSTSIRVAAPVEVRARLGAGVDLPTADLPPALLSSLKHAASMPNPEFSARQRRRASTHGIPRFIRSYAEAWTPQGDVVLTLPRGVAGRAEQLVTSTGSRWVTDDARSVGTPHAFTVTATLTATQQAAVGDVLTHDTGVLVAPPGAGKTVMACAAIADRGTSTLVRVDRRALAEQWRTRLREFLGVTAGQLGGGRTKLTGVVDVVLLPTLARRDDVAELTARYGQVVVDECHHLPAVAFQRAVTERRARYWLGLTATPYRRDGLDALITHHVGPVRHTITGEPAGRRAARTSGTAPAALPIPRRPASTGPEPVLHVHPTAFVYRGAADVIAPGGISAVYRDLVADDARTAQVVGDVARARAHGRHCLVLTQWTAHVERLAAALRFHGATPVVLRGGMGTKERAAALASLVPRDGDPPLLVVATGPFVGEGFDCPPLDTLFLAAPIAFRGRLVQYVGRILRPYPGKLTAEVHDYHDVHTGVLASSLAKRKPGYRDLGFSLPG